MDGLDKMHIEEMIDDPIECQYRVLLREFFSYDVPLACPYKSMLKAFYNNMVDQQTDSGLI